MVATESNPLERELTTDLNDLTPDPPRGLPLHTLVLSGISVIVGLAVVNTIRPGERIDPSTAQAIQARFGTDAAARVQATAAPVQRPVLTELIETLIPTNPFVAVSSPTPNLLHL